jgi:hypothetical protein
VEVVDPVSCLLDGGVADVGVVRLGPQEAGPDVFLDVVGDPHCLLEGEQAVAGGEGSGDLGDVRQVADGGGLHVAVLVVLVGRVGDDLGGVVDPRVLGGAGAGAAGASADRGGVGDHAVPSESVGASRADGVVREGVLWLVLEPVLPWWREGGGRAWGVAAAEGGSAVGVDVEGLVGARARARARRGVVLSHAGVLEVGAGDPGGGGPSVVEHPLQVVDVGDAEGEGAGGDAWRGEGEGGGGRELDGRGHG